jgi:hypothetical protein
MKTVLAAFVAWSRTHAGQPCPTIATLGAFPVDPWGTPLTLTCTDQPANQVAGVISAGPDGKLGTPDDRGSWQMPQEVIELVHGARWAAVAVAERAAPAPAAATPDPAPAPTPAKLKRRRMSDDSDDIPTER